MTEEHRGIVYDSPEKYFPYITHRLDKGKDKLKLKEKIIKDLFSVYETEGNIKHFKGKSDLFSNASVESSSLHKSITEDPNAVQIIIPRHKSLFDYIIHQPAHHDLINNKIIIVAGHNLFVRRFNDSLRYYGAFVFLRDDMLLKAKKLPAVFLSKMNYLKHVFPEYLKDQVFCDNKNRHDMLVYLEYEKDPRTGKSNSGRTKTGILRELNWSFLKQLYEMSRESGIKLYLTPVNVSFSKYPDAPYLVHPIKTTGQLNKNIRYLVEQSFVFERYSKFSRRNEDAKLDITIRYGESDCFSEMELDSFRDFKRYTELFKSKIGMLESIYPAQLVFLALGNSESSSMKDLSENMKKIFDRLQSIGAYVSKISDGKGSMLDPEDILNLALKNINRNPNLYIMNFDHHRIITYERGLVYCHDRALKAWYNNLVKHLLEEK